MKRTCSNAKQNCILFLLLVAVVLVATSIQNTALHQDDDDDNDEEDEGDDQADPLLLSGTTGVINGRVDLLVSGLQVDIRLLGVLLNGVHHLGLLRHQSLHVNKQLVQLL